MKDHITTVVTRYRGEVASWDVLNEMLDNWPGTTVKRSFWLDRMGPAYMDSALVWAHRADPGAKLYINDYLTEFPGRKSDFFLQVCPGLSRARDSGGRGGISDAHLRWASGLGRLQHLQRRTPSAPSSVPPSSGLPTRGTTSGSPSSTWRSLTLLALRFCRSRGDYRDVLDGCLKVSRCKEVTTWGLTDKYSWIPSGRPGFGRGLPFDPNYQKKPAFDSLLARLGRP